MSVERIGDLVLLYYYPFVSSRAATILAGHFVAAP